MSTSNSNRLLVGSPAVNADGQTGVFSGTGVIGLSPNYYFSPSLAGTGNHIITYTITDTYGCVNSVAQTINITGVLPIDLLDFKAENFDKSISLNWRTGEEKNVNFFSIERSKNGRDFKEIAKIKIGALSKEYTFSDEKPFYGTNYYRLKMTENDDSAVNFSKTVSVSFSTKGGIKVTPTLANYRITVDLPEKLGEITLNISDISGKVIKSVTTNGLQETVDISDLECGMYLVVVQSGVHKFAERFVKQ